MAYANLVFVAARWRAEYDASTDTMYIRAIDGVGSAACETEIKAVASDGIAPQCEFTCVPMGCATTCTLREIALSEGVKEYDCECADGAVLSAKSVAEGSGRKGSARTKKAKNR